MIASSLSLSEKISLSQARPVHQAPLAFFVKHPCQSRRALLVKAARAQTSCTEVTLQPPISLLSSWFTLTDKLMFQNMQSAPPSNLLRALMQIHALSGAGSTLAHVYGNLNPTQMLLPRLLGCKQELSALMHLLVAPSPWKPLESSPARQQEVAAAMSESALIGLYDDLWEEHDEGLAMEIRQRQQQQWTSEGELGEQQELLSQHHQAQHNEDAQFAQQEQGACPASAAQQLQQIKQALGLSSDSPESARKEAQHSAHGSLSSNNGSAISRRRSLSSITSLQRLCVLQLGQAVVRTGMTLQAEEAAACALLLAQLAHASGLISLGPHNLQTPDSPGSQDGSLQSKRVTPRQPPGSISTQLDGPTEQGLSQQVDSLQLHSFFGTEGGMMEQQGNGMYQMGGVVQQAVLVLVQHCLGQIQLRHASSSNSSSSMQAHAAANPQAHTAVNPQAQAALPPQGAAAKPQELAVLAAAATAAALCPCPPSAQLQPANEAPKRSSSKGRSTSSHTSSTSKSGVSSTSIGGVQEGASVAWWWDAVRQLTGDLLGIVFGGNRESGNSDGILKRTGSASSTDIKGRNIHGGDGGGVRGGGEIHSGGLAREDGEVLAVLLWALGKAGVNLDDERSRPWTQAVLLHLQWSAPLLSHNALLDVLWALHATHTLPHKAQQHSSDSMHVDQSGAGSNEQQYSNASMHIKHSGAGQQEGLENEAQTRHPHLHHHPHGPLQQQQQQQQQQHVLLHPQGLVQPRAPGQQQQQLRQGQQHTPVSFPLVLLPEDLPPWLAALLRELTKRRKLAAMSGKQLVGLLLVLTQAQVRLERQAIGRVLFNLHSRITHGCPSLSAHQLSMAMWALAKTRTSVKAQVMHKLLDRFSEQLPKASITDVASLVWAIPLVSKHYTTWLTAQHGSLLHALTDITLPHLTTCATQERTTSSQQSCGPRQLVQLAVGFTRLGFYPGAEWMRRHRAASIAVQHAFTSTDRAQIRAAYQTLLEV